jgi:peroxiredoxin
VSATPRRRAKAAEEIPADQMNETFVPVKRADVTEVVLDGEAVVLAEGSVTAHYLNEIGTLVWGTFDGSATIDELAADFASAFGVDLDLVRGDILSLARDVGRAGLLVGVSYEPPPEPSPVPMGVAVGESIPPFELPDAAGRKVSIEDLRGHQLLLVNWSPRCGFCLRIGAELGSLQAGLEDHGVELVFLTSGEVEENRVVFDEAGLNAKVLYVGSQMPEVFGGVGTPSAYLVDAEGRAASPLTIGADLVPSLVRTAAGREIPLTQR